MPDFPPLAQVLEGYEKISTTLDGRPTMYNLWIRRKDNQLLAELPRDFEARRYFIALTVASGETYAGLQAGEQYAYWKRFDKRLALISPNINTRSSGDSESKSSVQRLFTDRVILDIPIVAMNFPAGGPVIDLDALLVGHAGKFFGPSVQVVNPFLTTIKTAKAFEDNIEVGFQVPMANGQLKTLHYSISFIPDNPRYQPRMADQRIGYFTTSHRDLGKFKENETAVRFINRWHLQKRDPSLAISPAENPIVFYIEHTTPVRYRPWVKEGILQWNKAFEKVGIRDAIVVNQQDSVTGDHMEKDPEDVRYNFVRWLSNDQGTAIGPSRVHPLTGQILDADIILTDGWIRHYVRQYREVLPQLAMESYGPETMSWLESHPAWDPRLLLISPAERTKVLSDRAMKLPEAFGGHPLSKVDNKLIGDDEFDGLVGRSSQINGMCLCAQGKALDLAALRMTLAVLSEMQQTPPAGTSPGEAKKEEKKEPENLLDGIPEKFIGPLIAELVAHEVGHTLGLRHNFKASSVYSVADINSDKVKGKPFAGSVMDYLPINMASEPGKQIGDYSMVGIGPYDVWAIEYGYSLDKDLKAVLDRVAEPELQFATDEDTIGSDPLARRYDFGSDPINYAKNQMLLAKFHRDRLLEKLVKNGDSWSKARKGYEMTLFMQVRSLGMMSNWIGGAHIHRDKKGDKNGRAPLTVVPVAVQRDALQFVIDNAFTDASFGLTPDVLKHLSVDQWIEESFTFEETDWPVHDRIMGIQGSVLTSLLNPSTLRRVYDNELRTPADQDMITLPEILDKVSDSIWSELNAMPAAPASARKPWISSLRRNLQREHLERMIDLTLPSPVSNAATKPISNLSMAKLRSLKEKIAKCLEQKANMDPYSAAHLTESSVRIDKALDAHYIYNNASQNMRLPFIHFLSKEQPAVKE